MKTSTVPGGRTHNFKDFIDFPQIGNDALLYPKLEPVPVVPLETNRSILACMREHDLLLSFPYESFDYVIDLLREAAIDPKVTEIKVTLYRVARHSGIANALINAARNGKDVTAIIELQARFDEETNIALANQLQEEGAQVVFGVPGLKVHAKIGLILRQEKGKIARYAFLGTGNLNEDTAKLYSDHCLFTTDRRLTREVDAVFDFLQDNYRVPTFKHLVVAPFTFRERMVELVLTETKNAQKGKKAAIDLKLKQSHRPRHDRTPVRGGGGGRQGAGSTCAACTRCYLIRWSIRKISKPSRSSTGFSSTLAFSSSITAVKRKCFCPRGT